MNQFAKIASSIALLFSFSLLSGCGDGPRQVQETSEFNFDDMAAQAREDSALSEVEE